MVPDYTFDVVAASETVAWAPIASQPELQWRARGRDLPLLLQRSPAWRRTRSTSTSRPTRSTTRRWWPAPRAPTWCPTTRASLSSRRRATWCTSTTASRPGCDAGPPPCPPPRALGSVARLSSNQQADPDAAVTNVCIAIKMGYIANAVLSIDVARLLCRSSQPTARQTS